MIATSARVGLKGLDEKVVEKVGGDGYFARDESRQSVGEEQFFKQGEKAEVCDHPESNYCQWSLKAQVLIQRL